MAQKKLWNVLVPVVGLVYAETAEEAVRQVTRDIERTGYDVYDGEEKPSAFESEPAGDSPEDACTKGRLR